MLQVLVLEHILHPIEHAIQYVPALIYILYPSLHFRQFVELVHDSQN